MSQALPPAVKIGLRESSTVRWEHGSWDGSSIEFPALNLDCTSI
jgi:hypothetical protein